MPRMVDITLIESPEGAVARSTCPECGRVNEAPIRDVDKFKRWVAGEGNIQAMLPELTTDQRESFLTGICPRCWDRMFKPPEDE